MKNFILSIFFLNALISTPWVGADIENKIPLPTPAN